MPWGNFTRSGCAGLASASLSNPNSSRADLLGFEVQQGSRSRVSPSSVCCSRCSRRKTKRQNSEPLRGILPGKLKKGQSLAEYVSNLSFYLCEWFLLTVIASGDALGTGLNQTIAFTSQGEGATKPGQNWHHPLKLSRTSQPWKVSDIRCEIGGLSNLVLIGRAHLVPGLRVVLAIPAVDQPTSRMY